MIFVYFLVFSPHMGLSINISLWSSSSSLNRLQKVQNNAARLVLRKRKSDHVTPLSKQLHWLPIEVHIHYRIAALVFRHFENSLAPYLSEIASNLPNHPNSSI